VIALDADPGALNISSPLKSHRSLAMLCYLSLFHPFALSCTSYQS